MPFAEDAPLPDELVRFLDQLPQPLVEPESTLPVWALKLVEHYFAGGDMATVPGATESVALDNDAEGPRVQIGYEGVWLQFHTHPGETVRTFVVNDSPHRPSAFADGARVDSVLVFHEELDGPHAMFEFDGAEHAAAAADVAWEPLPGKKVFAVDDQSLLDAAALAAALGTTPCRCPGTLCVVWQGGP